MDSARSRPAGVLCVALMAFIACSRQQEQRSVDLTVPVTVQTVALGTIEAKVKATGTLRPLREAELVAQIKGVLHFEKVADGQRPAEGAPVAEGETVARLENEEWVVGVRLEAKRLNMETTKKTLSEQEVLFQRGLVTEKDVANARRSFAEAESAYQDALIQVAKTLIRAPISGFLTGLTNATEGTEVKQNTLIATIMDYSEVLVDLKIPNAQIQAVRLRQPVRVRNYAFPDRAFNGEVTSVDPALDPATRTFRAVGTIQNPDLLLRPGMFVEAEVVTEARQDAVLIPRRLLLVRSNRKVVFVEEGGRAEMREVETGLEEGEMAEVVKGLAAGERLVTSNYETLRSRTRVRVTSEGQGQRRPGN